MRNSLLPTARRYCSIIQGITTNVCHFLFCQNFIIISNFKSTLIQQVAEIKDFDQEPEALIDRFGQNTGIIIKMLDTTGLKLGEVIPKDIKVMYNPGVFQTMKNYKLARWNVTAGETHVSLGCVDFAQLLFGVFDGDLTRKIQFYGMYSSFFCSI